MVTAVLLVSGETILKFGIISMFRADVQTRDIVMFRHVTSCNIDSNPFRSHSSRRLHRHYVRSWVEEQRQVHQSSVS